MGIRLDQLHSEVFSKIILTLTNKTREVYDYLDTKNRWNPMYLVYQKLHMLKEMLKLIREI